MPFYEYKCRNQNCSIKSFDKLIVTSREMLLSDHEFCPECGGMCNKITGKGKLRGEEKTKWLLQNKRMI